MPPLHLRRRRRPIDSRIMSSRQGLKIGPANWVVGAPVRPRSLQSSLHQSLHQSHRIFNYIRLPEWSLFLPPFFLGNSPIREGELILPGKLEFLDGNLLNSGHHLLKVVHAFMGKIEGAC